jgi:hypothetical protein
MIVVVVGRDGGAEKLDGGSCLLGAEGTGEWMSCHVRSSGVAEALAGVGSVAAEGRSRCEYEECQIEM